MVTDSSLSVLPVSEILWVDFILNLLIDLKIEFLKEIFMRKINLEKEVFRFMPTLNVITLRGGRQR